MLVRRRKSRIYYLRRFFDYPISLTAATFRNMGLVRTVVAASVTCALPCCLGAKNAPWKISSSTASAGSST